MSYGAAAFAYTEAIAEALRNKKMGTTKVEVEQPKVYEEPKIEVKESFDFLKLLGIGSKD